MARLRVTDVYVRKPVYGGMHVIVESDTFFTIGEKFTLRSNGTIVGTFKVKKASIDGDNIVLQCVDGGDSIAYNRKMDIRDLVRGTIEYAPVVERDTYEDDTNEDDME